MNPELREFLLKNPHPGMCFLPMTDPTGKVTVVFFIQDEQKKLADLVGRLRVDVSFFAERRDLWIMRLDFYFNTQVQTELPGAVHLQQESGVAYYETEFKPSVHRPELERLLTQDILPVILFDRYTGYMNSKSITFYDKRPLLKLLNTNP